MAIEQLLHRTQDVRGLDEAYTIFGPQGTAPSSMGTTGPTRKICFDDNGLG